MADVHGNSLPGDGAAAEKPAPGAADEAPEFLYPMVERPKDGSSPYLPCSKYVLWAGPALGWYALRYHKGAYMNKFYIDDYPAASLGIIAFGSALSVLVDAFTDPSAAAWTDGCGSRFGRRRPFLTFSIFFVPLVLVFAWTPFESIAPSGAPASIWFCVFHILYKLADTIFLIPFDAWGSQLAPAGLTGPKIFMTREIFANTGLLLGVGILPLGLQIAFNDSEECSSTPGTSCVQAPLIAIILSFLFIVATFRLVWWGKEPTLGELEEHRGEPDTPLLPKSRFSATDTIPSLITTFLNAPYRCLLVGAMIRAISQSIPFTTLPFLVDAAIGQDCMSGSTLFAILLMVNIITTMVSLPIWSWAANKFGKWRTFLGFHVGSIVLILAAIPEPEGVDKCAYTYAAFPFNIFMGAFIGGSFVLQAMVVDCVSYDELLSGGNRREALYVMSVEFMTKFMEIPGQVLPLTLMALAGYARPPLEQPPCKASNFTEVAEPFNLNYTGLSLDGICGAFYAAEPGELDLCSRSKRCAEVLADGAQFVCHQAIEKCGVSQNEDVVWVLRGCFAITPIFALLGIIPLMQYPIGARTKEGVQKLTDALASMRSGETVEDPWRPGTQVRRADPEGPNHGILSYFFPSELKMVLDAAPTTRPLAQDWHKALMWKPLVWLVVSLILNIPGIVIIVAGWDDLGDDLGLSISPLGLALVGIGLLGTWFQASRLRAAWSLRQCDITRQEVVNQYNAVSSFIGAERIHI